MAQINDLSAASLVERSIEDIARFSRSCYRVEISSADAKSKSGFPFTLYSAKVLETLRGVSPENRQVSFSVPGSKVSNDVVKISGAPDFEKGEEYLVCLNPDVRDSSTQLVTFWTSYKVSRDQNSGERKLTREGEFVRGKNSRALRASSAEAPVQSYDNVVRRIMNSN